ncbi:hypothetical protein JL720_5413 [Aureococcus anophagefferens]|nr:hypothetical protein JL720_5413 [Aureococcus anophagefferens]
MDAADGHAGRADGGVNTGSFAWVLRLSGGLNRALVGLPLPFAGHGGARRRRCEWKKLDPRGRGSIPFEDLPQLLDGLGVDLSDDELEDAATRIQRWQASRLLLQGFLRWFAGDGGSARILGDGDLRAARDGLRELNAKHGEKPARDRAPPSLVCRSFRRTGEEDAARLAARGDALETANAEAAGLRVLLDAARDEADARKAEGDERGALRDEVDAARRSLETRALETLRAAAREAERLKGVSADLEAQVADLEAAAA